jgi:hypothetical protein
MARPSFNTEGEVASLVRAAKAGGSAFSGESLADLADKIRALPPGEVKTRERERFKSLATQAKAERTQAMKGAAAGGASPEQRGEIKAALKAPAPDQPRGAISGTLNALDFATGEQARKGVAAAAGIQGDVYKDSPTFHKAVEKEARQGKAGAQAIELAKSAGPGYVLGTIAGAIPQLRGAKPLLQLGGAALSALYDQTQKPELSDLVTGEAGNDTLWNKTKRIGFDIVADPLNAVKAISPIQAAVTNAEKLLAPLGKADQAADLVRATLGQSAQPSAYGLFASKLEEMGVAADKIAQTFGRSGQYFGRGEMGLGLGNAVKSVTPGYGFAKAVDTPAALIESAQVGAKGALAQKAANLLPETRALPSEVSAAKNAMKASRREATAISEEMRQGVLSDARNVAGLVKGLKPGEYQEIVARYLDPGIADKGGYVLTPEKQAVADAVSDFFTKHQTELQQMGVKLAFNSKSGKYYPRNFGVPRSGDDDLLQGLIDRTQKATANRGVPTPNFTPRQGDVAWGDVIGPAGVPTAKGLDVATASELARKGPDFAKDFASYGRQLSEAKGFEHLRRSLEYEFTKGGKVTDQAAEFLTRSYSNMARSIESRADKLLYPDSSKGWMASAGRNALEALDAFSRAYKVNNLLLRFPYHVTNVFGDGTLMAAHGVNPFVAVTEAISLVMKAMRGDKDAQLILKAANDVNIGTLQTFGQRLEFPGATRLAQETNELKALAGEKLSPIEKLHGATTRIPGVKQVNRISQQWESISKLGVYIDGLRQGLSPQQASQRAYDILIDYGATTGQTGLAAGVQKAVLFYNYLTQASKSGAKALTTQPAAFMVGPKVATGLSDRDVKTQAPRYMRESGTPIALSPQGKALVSEMRQYTGGTSFQGDTYVNPRLGGIDALGLPASLADTASNIARGGTPVLGGELTKLGRYLEPNAKFLLESFTGTDTLTGGPKRPGPELARPPIVQPIERYAREVLAPGLIPSPLQAIGNSLARHLGGDDVTIGRADASSPERENLDFNLLMGQLSPWKPVEVSPTSEHFDRINSPETQQFKAVSDYNKKTAEERRALFRRSKKRTTTP